MRGAAESFWEPFRPYITARVFLIRNTAPVKHLYDALNLNYCQLYLIYLPSKSGGRLFSAFPGPKFLVFFL